MLFLTKHFAQIKIIFHFHFLDSDVPLADESMFFILPADEKDTNEYLAHNVELADLTKSYIRKEIRLSRGRWKKKIELAKFIFMFFRDSLSKNSFRCWLCKELSIKHENLIELLSWKGRNQVRGKERGEMYVFYFLEHSLHLRCA